MPRLTPVSIMRLRTLHWWLRLLKSPPAFNFKFKISFSPSRNADETMAELLSVGADPPLPWLQGILRAEDLREKDRDGERRGE